MIAGEVGADESCPCGSGELHRDCCAPKSGFRWIREPDGSISKSVKLDDEIVAALDELHREVEKIYGRPLVDEDLPVSFMMSNASNPYEMARAMRAAGVDEDYIYAYTRTDGLMPTETNLDHMSRADLEEFDSYREEYDQRLGEGISNDHVDSLVFVHLVQPLVQDAVDTASRQAKMVLSNFISRHRGYGQFVEFEVATSLDYALFSAHKAMKTLRSIEHLGRAGMPEAIYALSRTLFENYLFLNAIAQERDFFVERILPKADRENYEFDVKDGRINYNRVIHRESGEAVSVWVSPQSLIKYSSKPSDDRLYALFYQTSSRYIHVDVLSARAYFYEADPFDEIDPALVAHLVALVMICMLIGALGELEDVQDNFRPDAAHFVSVLAESLGEALVLVESDVEHSNAAISALIDALAERGFRR